jgi:hypothetical protein
MNARCLASSLLFLLAACDGGEVEPLPGEVDSGLFNSGLDDAQRVADLDSADAAAFCEAVGPYTERFFSARMEKVCLFQGSIAAGFADLGNDDPLVACENALAECRATFDPGPRDCALEGSSCIATIGQLENCYNETVGLLQMIFEHLDVTTCQEIVDWKGEKLKLSDLPSCEPIEDGCPRLDWGLLTE